jgi:hypothetical protein
MMRQLMMQLGASTGLLGKIPGLQQFAQMKKFAGIDMNQLAGLMNTPSAERGSFQAPKRNLDKVKEKRQRKARKKARKKRKDRPLGPGLDRDGDLAHPAEQDGHRSVGERQHGRPVIAGT